MDKKTLIDRAGSLKTIELEFVREFSEKKDTLAAIMNKKMLERADIHELVGENNSEMMKDNHANHLRFMESMFWAYDPEIMVDTVLWVFRAYRIRGFASTYWAAQINTWIQVFRETLSKECNDAILPYYEWIQVNIPSFTNLSSHQLNDPDLKA